MDETAEYISLESEDGEQITVEVLMRFEYQDKNYIAVCSADESDSSEEADEVHIFRVSGEYEDGPLDTIDDEDELQGAYEAMMDLLDL